MAGVHHSEKFGTLRLSKCWEGAASYVDFQLSDPNGASYKTELGATWRGLLPSTQRSYIVVAVKKIERQANSSSGHMAAEAWLSLQNAVYELLWMNSSSIPSHVITATRHSNSTSGHVLSDRPVFRRPVEAVNLAPESTDTVLPLSAARYNLDVDSRATSRPRCHASYRNKGHPSSPLALYASGREDDDEIIVSSLADGLERIVLHDRDFVTCSASG